ncbi:MAG: hypothetical protein KJ739_07035 [Nitrospinae bacterium]|nr:hypothetical protein [Nitrospinota bacterium]
MEVYKNDYERHEDEALWEMHKIRHQLHKELKGKPIEKINSDALKRFNNWRKLKEKASVT